MLRILVTILLAAFAGLVGVPPAIAADLTLSGTVTGPGGAPVSQGTMYADSGQLDEWDEPVTYQDDLDQSGGFNISLPPGTYELCTDIDSSAGLADECREVTVGVGGLSGVDFQLDSLPHVSGTVGNDAGVPVVGTMVELYRPDEFTGSSSGLRGGTDGDGKYSIAVPVGTYTLCAGDETSGNVDRRCTEGVNTFPMKALQRRTRSCRATVSSQAR